MSKEDTVNLPPPVLLSCVVCERVIFDLHTRMPSIICVLQTIAAPRYPARHALLALFCELTNGRGKITITARLVDVQEEDEILLDQQVEGEFTDVRQVVGLMFGFEGLVFPHPGEYRFQVYAGTELLGERRIICRQVQLTQRGDKDESAGKK
jgi:hypothetical protein